MTPSIDNLRCQTQQTSSSAKPIPIRHVTEGSAISDSVHVQRTEELLRLPHGKVTKVCCIGAGYVGGPTSAVMANKNPDLQVTVVDLSIKRIEAWKSDQLPIYEPGLLDAVKLARDGDGGRKPNLFFSTDVDTAVREAELILVSVNTPTKITGTGAGRASELSYFESAVRTIAEVATTDKIIVEKSTVPCRTAENMREILSAIGHPGVNFEILSNPEFLAEGTAIPDLMEPDRILIGSLNTAAGLSAAAALADVYAAWVPRENIITMNTFSSELAKLAANALLAQRISSINALSAVCEATGADIEEVSYAVGLDTRIGRKMLKASVGFGGSCFKKDVLSLAYISETLHLPEVAAYWRSVVDINEYQKDRFTKRIIQCLFNSLKNKKIAILGFAYKKDTGDTRESAAITVVESLVAEDAKLSIYDPRVEEEQVWSDLKQTHIGLPKMKENVTLCSSVYDACADSHAVIILTEWDDTSSGMPRMDWAHVASVMRRPMFVFDGRNVVDKSKLEDLGFRVECIGKPGSASFRERGSVPSGRKSSQEGSPV
ncbi:UDP-glucose 6-dehydrogenase [Eremomyces bilateralis CBS 781.70]|uniref:UDP-glucose 6-dehydrogenase n=1 Tax=Eremomyces bilateralis CBS 781.70 TaxID=1392243 RepID=A0A6G1G883_9PEZI|nr:UDP-glucose 6-dehydrogenase [Eremomyces bilateralis CBS 781.70]KAF1814069.1 UDP-glucose 6-dehydrogenase [Eremomyces bilateralis CBS 781.70]